LPPCDCQPFPVAVSFPHWQVWPLRFQFRDSCAQVPPRGWPHRPRAALGGSCLREEDLGARGTPSRTK
jgi:hypothetical protein